MDDAAFCWKCEPSQSEFWKFQRVIIMSLASSFIVQDSKPVAVYWSDWLPLRKPGKVNIVGWQTGGGHRG
jgi:hypothetical protein